MKFHEMIYHLITHFRITNFTQSDATFDVFNISNPPNYWIVDTFNFGHYQESKIWKKKKWSICVTSSVDIKWQITLRSNQDMHRNSLKYNTFPQHRSPSMTSIPQNFYAGTHDADRRASGPRISNDIESRGRGRFAKNHVPGSYSPSVCPRLDLSLGREKLNLSRATMNYCREVLFLVSICRASHTCSW